MTEHIAILISENDRITDSNYCRIGNELGSRGYRVSLCTADSLSLNAGAVMASGFSITDPLHEGDLRPAGIPIDLEQTDLVWVMSLGKRGSFLDRFQLLYLLSFKTRVINSLDAIMHLKSKYFLAGHPEIFRYPETHASTNPDELFNIVATGGRWVVKPPAGSLGRDVFLVDEHDSNTRVILSSLCGVDNDQYVLLQRYVPEISQGEKRVLICGGEPVGTYSRHATLDHRTNLARGATGQAARLTAQEQELCKRLGKFLNDLGAVFVGVDLVGDTVIECNVISPGGLATIESLTGEDLCATAIDRIWGALATRSPSA